MRLLALLLSVYFACLACLPCADEAPAGAALTTSSYRPALPAHPSHHALGDWCSPLCQCQCCASGIVAPLAVARLQFVRPAGQPWASSPRYAALQVAAPRHRAGAVWQPPRA